MHESAIAANDTLVRLQSKLSPSAAVLTTVELYLSAFISIESYVLDLLISWIVPNADTNNLFVRWDLQTTLKLMALLHFAKDLGQNLSRILAWIFEQKLNRTYAIVHTARDAEETALRPRQLNFLAFVLIEISWETESLPDIVRIIAATGVSMR